MFVQSNYWKKFGESAENKTAICHKSRSIFQYLPEINND